MNSVAMQDALLCALLSRPYAKFLARRLNFKNRTNLRPNRASIDRDTCAQSMGVWWHFVIFGFGWSFWQL